jgi:hypothetical protein
MACMFMYHPLDVDEAPVHLAVPSGEYDDWSCSMGYCCLTRGYNTPHVLQVGWGLSTFSP